jgi:hypothetical protein
MKGVAPSARRTVKWLTILVLGGAAALAGWNWSNRNHLTTMLNIDSLPRSVRNIDCDSYGFTDVLERCSFDVDSADFPDLLAGYNFQIPRICSTKGEGDCVDKPDAGMSHDYCCGPKTGANFAIATTYFAEPKDAPHGGSITVLTDKSRQRAMVDLYIE